MAYFYPVGDNVKYAMKRGIGCVENAKPKNQFCGSTRNGRKAFKQEI